MKMIDGRQARVAVIGSGAFGTALAACAQAGGNSVTLFTRHEARLKEIKAAADLSGCNCVMQSDETIVLSDFDLILLSIPSQAMRETAEWMRMRLKTEKKSQRNGPLLIVSAAKGIERGTLLLPHQILEEIFGNTVEIATLSGPSFAKELRMGLATSVVVASKSPKVKRVTQELLHRSFFRVYDSDDITGVEVCGALKNVIALVAGAVDGLKLGNNARAAVITRGLGEIAQVGVKMGADPMTFLGLGGIGDLILTCTGDLSRNRQVGMRLAAGEKQDDIIASMGEVVEGVTTAQSAYTLSQKFGLDTPIFDAVYSVLYQHIPLTDALKKLLMRHGKAEFQWVEK